MTASTSRNEPSRDGPMRPCPYCEGPPAIIVKFRDAAGNLIRDARIEESEDGLHAEAFVFCHECGAQGPEETDIVFKGSHADQVKERAKVAWNTRDARHRDLYESGIAAGLFARSETPFAPDTVISKLLEDIRDRSGLGDAWNEIDVDTRNEIIATWRGFFK
jgi:hypothetical protein